ncbi:hypothetical protein [Afipia sp. GAS231]|nr:hypothetical protein [Afipia sp. GAS231]
MNDGALAKLVVTVVLLITLVVWRSSERAQRPDCGVDCPTDISASRK